MTEISNFAIFGVGGCGRGIMPLAREQLAGRTDVRLVFVDDAKAGQIINGHDVLDLEAFRRLEGKQSRIAIAIADPTIRRVIAGRCEAAGLSFFQVCTPKSFIMDAVKIGEGALIAPFVTLTSNIQIGRHFHANLYSYVEHDCVIGDFVTFAPGVQCNGNVHIEDNVYIGAGAIIRQGKSGFPLEIGRGAFVGMGAIVTKNVPPGVTVAGNPARPFQRGQSI
jgi:sugar O-acyltransferase (sialic acid O-acetyltransferase NeuD family)